MSTTSFRAPAKRSPASMPEYQRQNFATPGADASARLSDSAAGIYERGADQTGRQLMALGGAIQQAAKVGDDLYVDYSKTKGTEAYTAFQDAMRDKLYGKDGVFNTKGEAALDSPAQTEIAIQKAKEEVSQNLKVSGLGRQFFDRYVDMYQRETLPQAQKHATTEWNNWQVSTYTARAEQALQDSLTHKDDPGTYISSGTAATETLLKLRGASDEAVTLGKQKFQSAAWTQIAQSFLTDGNLRAASNIAKRSIILGEDKIRLQTAIRAEAKRMEAEARAQSQMNFLNAFASDPLKGIAEISTPEGQAKYGMDAKTAMGLRGMLQTQWSFNKQVEKEQRDNYTTQTINGIYDVLTGDPQKGVAPDPAKAYQLLQDSSLDAVAKIEMGRKLEEGTFGKVRDPGAVNDMARRIVSGEIASDAPIDVMLALGQASVGDVAALKAMRKDMEGPLKDYGKRWDSLVNNAYARSQFASGTPEAAIKEDRARSQGMKLIKEAYEKGGDEAVEKLFEESTLLTVLRNNATNLNDELEHMNTVIKAGSPQDSKLHRPGESGAEYLSRRLGKVPKQHPEGE